MRYTRRKEIKVRNAKKYASVVCALAMATSSLAGCTSGSSSSESTKADTTVATTEGETVEATEKTTEEPKDETTVADTTEEVTEPVESTTEADNNQFIEIGINVYYNDSDNDYYSNESGEVIKVFEEGQYTLTFDCDKDLSDAAKDAGVDSLTNLTAIYLLDMGIANDEQSPLKGCNIMWDAIAVDGTELTVTLEKPKSAFKSSGKFDTNDPINAWEGSYVDEIDTDTENHVANFSTVDNPKTISITFTLSDMDWEGESGNNTPGEATGNDYVNEAVFSDIDFTDVTAVEFTKYLGNGINLGNTMEACNSALGKKAKVSSYETAWGQPVTSEDMIKGMKNCGFDTIRIPVAWTNMMDFENGDYTIAKEYLDRVEEITKWALDAEMFVIINDHWDSGWWDLFAGNDEEVEQAWKILEEMWTQVAERFADYSDMVIFESANEELGRSWTSKGMSTDDSYKLTTKVNQKFVDIVRASGGNNDDRFLLIAGNATDIELTISKKYKMPKDTVDNKLLISVHYYDPWNYCGDKNNLTLEQIEGYRWGLKTEYTYMADQVAKMDKFTEAGYGVIIGEWGALPAYVGGKSVVIPCTNEYTEMFLNVCDVHNFCPVLWSTGTFNRTTMNMLTDELTDIFTAHCYAEEVKAGDGYIDAVKDEIKQLTKDAPAIWPGQESYEAGTPVAWIMWNGGAGTYSVGDTFNAADCTAGITATNVVVEGAGTYSVSLDFAGGNTGLTFAALGLASGEDLYPGCILDIKSITMNGEEYTPIADAFTSSDDGHCTRVNLLNAWVNTVPSDARNASGDLSNASTVIINGGDVVDVKNITITFELIEE